MGRLIKGGHYSRGDTIFHPLFSYGETNQGGKPWTPNDGINQKNLKEL
jgi:hypothetical protein